MNDLKYSEILAVNRNLAGTLPGPTYRIAILSNIVITQLKDILEYILRRQGINAEVIPGEYDNIVQDSGKIGDVSSVIVFWEAANLLDGFQASIGSKSADEIEALVDRMKREIQLVTASLKNVPTVLFNRFSALPFSQFEVRPNALQALCVRLNGILERAVSDNQLIVDIDKVMAGVGLSQAVDFRQFQSSKCLYAIPFLKAYANFVEPVFRAVNGRARKVLALDCDNTLWGGILGEDGTDGVRMTDATLDGRAFREVQFLLKDLKNRGVILTLCTKNNPHDIQEVLDGHPAMVLRDADFAAKAVNWNDKASNLRALAQDLNLGLDSFVFLDDSPFELGLIAKELPQVLCVAVPSSPSAYPPLVRRLAREFFLLASSAEDARKTEMYREESGRKSAAQQHTSVEDYLASLELVIKVDWNGRVAVARAAQLSQKTNQFNLTTRRYTDADVKRMIEDPAWSVATLSVVDRYGDYGVTGLLIMRNDAAAEANIDTFLLSCRVLGRNVERALFDYLVRRLSGIGIKSLNGEYLRTPKNDQVAKFFESLGFRIVNDSGAAKSYHLDLAQYIPANIGYIKVTDSD